MNLRQIELLRAVIKCETTIGAGRELGLSQPAVSNAIKHMETQVGFPLFERINNRLFPTPEALAIHRESEPIFCLHAALERRVKDLKDNKSGNIHLITTPPLGYSVIPSALQQFFVHHPKVRVSLDIKHFDNVLESVDNGLAELGFVMALTSVEPTLEAEIFFEGRMVCVMPPDHPLAARTEVTPADLVGERLIALDRDTRMGTIVRRAFAEAGQPFDFAVEVRYCHAACLLADSGVGVAVVDPLSPLCGKYADLIVRPFVPVCPVTASVVTSRKRPLSRTAKAFLREVRAIAGDVARQLDIAGMSGISG
jgi:DNA-binding transcriptional LysR family regulator